MRLLFAVLLLGCNIIFLSKTHASNENSISLKQILKKSLKDSIKTKEIEAEANINWGQLVPLASPWETQLNTSFEKLWSDSDNTGGDIKYKTYNLSSRLNQKTPYGLSLNLNYDKVFDLPNVNVFLYKENINGNIYLSLWNDFLGKNTRRALKLSEVENKKIITDQNLIQSCQKISSQYFDTYKLEQNIKVLKESLDILNSIQKRISPSAISEQNFLSLKIDRALLENNYFQALRKHELARIALSDLTRLHISEIKNLNLEDDFSFIKEEQQKKLKIIERLNVEITLLEAKKKLLQLNQKNDISLYSGFRSNETLPLNTLSQSSVVGLNISWTFGNAQIKNSENILDFEISKRDIAKQHILNQKESLLNSFAANIKNQVEITKTLKTAKTNADLLLKIAQKNFLNGKIGFTEFLNLRNQVNNLKTEFINAITDTYNTFLDQSVYVGDVESSCFFINSEVKDITTSLQGSL